MRKLILTAATSAAIAAGLSFLPIGGAAAMTPGTASGVRAAIAETNPSVSVAYGCRRGYYGYHRCHRRHYYGGYHRRHYYGGYYGGYGYPGYYGYSSYYGDPYYGGYYRPGIGVGIGIGVGPRWGW
jgi:hypothetical protein